MKLHKITRKNIWMFEGTVLKINLSGTHTHWRVLYYDLANYIRSILK